MSSSSGRIRSLTYAERCKLRAKFAGRTIRSQVEEDCRKLQNRAGLRFPSLDPNGPPPGMPRRPRRHPTRDDPEPQPPQAPPNFQFKVGIIGAGMAGLYTAMILDSMNINYEILEASHRAGGRVYTHYFHPVNRPGNYYDVGAMRFPNIPIMHRTFNLFHRLDIHEDLNPNPAQETLIPYYLTGPRTPLLYNNILFIPPVDDGADPDTFRVSVANGGTVPDE